MTPEAKQDVVDRFLQGQSLSDVSNHYAIARRTAESVVRETIVQLAILAAHAPQSSTPIEENHEPA